MPRQKRSTHSPELKAKVVLEAVRGMKTANEIAQEFGVHPVQVGQWKKALLSDSATLFNRKRGPSPKPEYQTDEKLYGEIGRLKMERVIVKSGVQRSGCVPVWLNPDEEDLVYQQDRKWDIA